MAYGESIADRLAAVRTAIGKCLTAEEFHGRGRGARMSRLKDLRELEKELMDELAAESAGGSMSSLAIQTRET